MGSRDDVPVSARLRRCKRGVMTRGPDKGREVVLELLEGTTSHGYKSSYRSVQTRFVRWRVKQDSGRWRSKSWRFTGKRFDKAVLDYEEVARHIRGEAPNAAASNREVGRA